ncbi:PKD domain-containing protein [Caminibacter pacificus]|uniref:PKD domain-containing protein n=2 Tax=Caminibacter pacificus TaxID=1424653 RepID=A0AAJ4RCG5_9BACT|nr:PKD domain-containing protein [Caminibacter pacificus]QCI28956.1 PKD domain-containing protein [Caminibacter pacificus]ROR39548.1 PKD repeat protein [Caminibacter pacificus]
MRSRFFSLVFLIMSLFFLGCNSDKYVIDSDMKDGTKLNNNTPEITFSIKNVYAMKLDLDNRKILINNKDYTNQSIVDQNNKLGETFIILHPTEKFPEGNVTIELKIPLKKQFQYSNLKPGYKKINIYIDSVAPEISVISPDINKTIRDKYTSFEFNITDKGSGVNSDSIQVNINNKFINYFTYSNGKLKITPPKNNPLPDYDINIEIIAKDNLQNIAIKKFAYKAQYDSIPPSIELISPIENIITDPMTPLVFKIYDDENGSGVNINSVYIEFNETNETYALKYDGNDTFEYVPQNPYNYGDLIFNVYAKDNAGNSKIMTFNLYVKEQKTLKATPVAYPDTAYAPATIKFSPEVETDNAIQDYYWDFDGDGIYDSHDITAQSYSHIYYQPGDYNVTLKVVDLNGNTAIGNVIVHILNRPPSVDVSISPSNGQVPLKVSFNVTASDSDGIDYYAWDFDGDGIYDYNSTTTGTTSYTYTKTGVYKAKLIVADKKGAVTEYTAPTTTVLASDEGSPTVTAIVSPNSGDAPLQVSFSANVEDPLNKGVKLYEWDFDGDGIYDYNSTETANTQYTYEKAGTFYPVVRITTTDDRVTYDAAEVKINQKITLTIQQHTIDLFNAETSEIQVELGAASPVEVVVKDRENNIVKVLQTWEELAKGVYDYTWDGKDDNGNELPQGDYYVVVNYKIDDKLFTYDLRDTTGGNTYNPWRTNSDRYIYPFENKPMTITFRIDYPSEVISFVGYSWSNTRVITFRNREPLGAGTYTDVWYSQNDNGAFITPPPGSYFLYGIWAYRLADNVIYVRNGAEVDNVQVSPSIFSPDINANDKKTLKVSFSLNKKAKIELEVYDAELGMLVATRTYNNIEAGDTYVLFDGKDNNGVYLRPGKYTVGIRAVDETGYRSIMKYNVFRIYY